MKKKIIVATTILFLLIAGEIAIAETTNEEQPGLFRIIERIQNRIRDLTGNYLGNVSNLTEITGLLEYDGRFFRINETELHFGPDWYIKSALSAYDYDGDDVNETVFGELQGLIDSGENVTVSGYLQSEDWLSVFYINGELYREPGQPIWASQHHWRVIYRWTKNRQENNSP